jgi:hypothetical protein
MGKFPSIQVAAKLFGRGSISRQAFATAASSLVGMTITLTA